MRIINRKLRNNLSQETLKRQRSHKENFSAAFLLSKRGAIQSIDCKKNLAQFLDLFLETGGNTYAGNEK